MLDRAKLLFLKYREMIMYVIVGGMTTVVSYGGYFLFNRFMNIVPNVASVLADIAAIIFAYVLSRLYVFEAKASGAKQVAAEALKFGVSRALTLFLNWLIILVFVENMGMFDGYVRAAATVIVVVLNYILSKIFVFREVGNEKHRLE